MQNKLHYAVHGQTAAEVIVDRADHQKENMGLTHWEGAPHGKIHKYDVSLAKNYRSEFELAQMQRIVSAYLDMAELQPMRRIPMTMQDWEERLSGLLDSGIETFCRMQARCLQKSPRHMPKANSRNTASCRIGCLRAILTAC